VTGGLLLPYKEAAVWLKHCFYGGFRLPRVLRSAFTAQEGFRVIGELLLPCNQASERLVDCFYDTRRHPRGWRTQFTGNLSIPDIGQATFSVKVDIRLAREPKFTVHLDNQVTCRPKFTVFFGTKVIFVEHIGANRRGQLRFLSLMLLGQWHRSMGMKFPLGLSFSVFLLGFVSAWLLRPLATPQKQQEAEPLAARRSSSKRAAAKANASSPARYQKHLENIDLAAAKRDEISLSDALQNIPISDIPGLLEAWQKRAGFIGLGHEERSHIQKLLARWYEHDATGAIAWLGALEHGVDAQIFLKKILIFEAGRDFDRMLKIGEQFARTDIEGGWADFPFETYQKLKECDAEMVGRFLRVFPRSFGGEYSIDYQEGFDFATLGKMFVEDQVTKQYDSYSYYPYSFLKEWAKKDVHAAWDWSVKHHDVPVMGVHHVFHELTKEIGGVEANEKLIHALANKTGWYKYRYLHNALTDETSAEQIANILENLSGPRIDNLEGLANEMKDYAVEDTNGINRKLFTLMTPEERRLVVPKTYGHNKKHTLDPTDAMKRTLKELGHSLEEINAMIPSG
jgi:hypothetical protein